MAVVTYRYVELPARRLSLARIPQVVGAGVMSLAVFALVGQRINASHGLWALNLDPEIRRLDKAIWTENVYRRNCYGAGKAFGNEAACTFGRPRAGGSYDMVIFGDSHANHYVPTMKILAERAGFRAGR